jgi:hypothetical protein
VRPAVSAAMDFRDLLGYRPETLVKGLMLLSPGQRARLRQALDAADWPGMSLINSLENEAEKVFRAVEADVEKIDGQALAEARRLIAEAKAAESRILTLVSDYRAEIAAAVEKYGPEVVQLVEAELEKLLGQAQNLFGVRAGQ